MTVYVHPNPELVFKQIKGNMRDVQRGGMSREAFAESLRSLADKVEKKKPECEQLTMSLDEVQEHLKNHLAQNRGVK